MYTALSFTVIEILLCAVYPSLLIATFEYAAFANIIFAIPLASVYTVLLESTTIFAPCTCPSELETLNVTNCVEFSPSSVKETADISFTLLALSKGIAVPTIIPPFAPKAPDIVYLFSSPPELSGITEYIV